LWIGMEDLSLQGYSWLATGDGIQLQRPSDSEQATVQVISSLGQLLLEGQWVDGDWAFPSSLSRDRVVILHVQEGDKHWIQRIPLR